MAQFATQSEITGWDWVDVTNVSGIGNPGNLWPVGTQVGDQCAYNELDSLSNPVTVNGDGTYTATPGSDFNYAMWNATAGPWDGPFTEQVPEEHTIAGDVTYTLTPTAIMAYSVGGAINGQVFYTITPTAVTEFTKSVGILGDVTYTITPTAVLQYLQALNPSIIGDVTYILTPTSVLNFNAFQVETFSVNLISGLGGDMALISSLNDKDLNLISALNRSF